MTKQSKTVAMVIALLAVATIAGIAAVMRVMSGPAARTVTVEASPATRKADPHAASASLGQLDLMRQSVLEADIPGDMRKNMIALVDDRHAKTRAVLDDEALPAATRDERLMHLRTNYARDLNEFTDIKPAIIERSNLIWFELDLLSRRRLLPLMFDKLGMTDAQHKSADAAFMEMSVVLHNEPAGGLPNERSMQAMLTCREKLHALLTPEQRTKFDQVLHDEQQRRQSAVRAPHTGTTFPMNATTTTTTKSAD